MNTPDGIATEKLKSWYEHLNEVVSILLMTSAVTALQFKEHSAEVATLMMLFIFLLVAVIAQKKRIKFYQDRMKRIKGNFQVTLSTLLSCSFFFLGLSSVLAVSLGYGLDDITGFSLKAFLNL